MITITLTHDPQRLNDLQPQWVALQANSASDSICQTWEWVSIWWQFFGSNYELWLLTAESPEGLIGIAPLMQTKNRPAPGVTWRELQFIGATSPRVHFDFLIAAGQEAAVLPHFIETLKEHHKRWDILRLERFMGASPNLPLLQKMDIPWQEGESVIAPYIVLPSTWDDYVNLLSKRRRKNLRRAKNRIEKLYPNNWQFDWVREAAQLAPTLNKLIETHQGKWETKDGRGAFPDDVTRQFFHALIQCFLEKGWMRLYRLEVGGQQIASQIAYLYRERMYCYTAGIEYDFPGINPGHLLEELSIKDALESGAKEYDFLWGEDEYKYSWGAKDRVDPSLVWVASSRARQEAQLIEIAKVIYRPLRKVYSKIR